MRKPQLYGQLRVRSQVLWYILWSTMLVISGGNVLLPYSVFSSSPGVTFSILIAAVAGIHLMRGIEFLGHKNRSLASALCVLFGAAQFGWWLRTFAPTSMYRGFDFSAYYLAAKLVSTAAGKGLYNLPLYADGRMDLLIHAPAQSASQVAALHYDVPFSAPYIYPPFFAALMKPIAHLSFASAYIIWGMVTLLLIIGAILLAFRLAGVGIDRNLALLLGVGLFSYFPLYECLLEGQLSGLILFLMAAGVWLMARNHPSLSALSFAVATMIKLTPILAVPLLIIHRRWRWLAAYVGWMCALLAFSVWQAGWALHQQFWSEVLPRMSCGAAVDQNCSLVAYVQELFLGYVPIAPDGPLTLPKYACAVSRIAALSVYLLMLFRFYWKRRDRDVVRDLVLMAMLGLVVSPISWTHHALIALLPMVYLWCKMPEKGSRVLLVVFIMLGSNVIGYALLMATNPLVQLMLASIVPGLMIALVYVSLSSGRDPARIDCAR